MMKNTRTREILEGLSSEDTKFKYACVKNLLATSRDSPDALYPHFDFFVKLLRSENRIIKWMAIEVIGFLARVDDKDKTGKLHKKLFGFLKERELITANHAIAALAKIAASRPEHLDKITRELLKVEYYTYATEECRNIALGKVIQALDPLSGHLSERRDVYIFAVTQTKNTRAATSKKAHKLLKRLKKTNSRGKKIESTGAIREGSTLNIEICRERQI